MARQFYTIEVQSATKPVIIHFDKPVRKIQVAVLSNYIAVSVGTEIDTDRMMIFSVVEYGSDGDNEFFIRGDKT